MNDEQFFNNSIGEILKKAREGQRKTYEEVADITKIPQKYIEALENDDFSEYPNIKDFHIKSYIGKLCSLYSIPPEQIIQRYFANHQQDEKKVSKTQIKPPNSFTENYHSKAIRSNGAQNMFLGNLSGWIIGFCSLIAIVIIFSLISSFFRSTSSETPPMVPQQASSQSSLDQHIENRSAKSSDSIAIERFISVPAIRQARIPDKDY